MGGQSSYLMLLSGSCDNRHAYHISDFNGNVFRAVYNCIVFSKFCSVEDSSKKWSALKKQNKTQLW